MLITYSIMTMQGDYTEAKATRENNICSHFFKIVGLIAFIFWDNVQF